MSKTIDEIKELKSKMKTLREELDKKSEDGFRKVVQGIFEEHPTLVQFSWTQFTPYFNDGDPCYFSSGYEEFEMSTSADDDPEYFSSWDCEKKAEKGEALTAFDKAGLAIEEVLMVFDNDDYENMFGDHCRVVVTSEGIEVEGYRHD